MPLKNAQVDAGGGGSHTMADFLKRAEDQGIRFVNVSPVREDLEGVPSAEWIPIRPGTDTAMILAMAHVIASEGKADQLVPRCILRWL